MSGKNGRITAYINKKAIAANFQNMKANLKDGVKMVAVIKTDGYGHGAVPIAQMAEPYDYIWGFAVAAVGRVLRCVRPGSPSRSLCSAIPLKRITLL